MAHQDLPREVRTERLALRQWRPEDVAMLAEIYTEPSFLEHMPQLDLEQTEAQIERFRRQWVDEGFSHWAAEDVTTGRLIGRIGLLRHRDWPLSEAPVEVGWCLHPEFWGRGLATEGGRVALELWREQLTDDTQLISITLPSNTRSRRVMAKLGLTDRGTADWHGHTVVWHAIDR